MEFNRAICRSNNRVDQLGEERVSDLNAKRCKKFVEKREGDSQRRARFTYLKAFIEFCAGKKNIYCDDTPLKELTQLTELDLRNNQISEPNMEDLQEALPKCTISSP